ncbi:MAG: helix-hairpin-helix domain-containing protein [Gemmatimonadota bacterium]
MNEEGATPSNDEIAVRLLRIADLLDAQEAEGFRVRAYRSAANTVWGSRESVAAGLEAGGRKALERLPAIGRSISALIEEYVETGRIGLLDRLEGHVSPEDVLCRVPGIGETLAARIHERLGVETLEELEAAAHDGRLEGLPGFGARRVAALQGVLESMLRRRSYVRGEADDPHPAAPRPPVSLLLQLDEEYRSRAEANELRTIAPKRFNPAGRAWLPILHRSRREWHFTALYSNTALAHHLGKTHDWVVIYYEDHGYEGQCTVVTEYEGLLETWRVVRGRERECLDWYSHVRGWQLAGAGV